MDIQRTSRKIHGQGCTTFHERLTEEINVGETEGGREGGKVERDEQLDVGTALVGADIWQVCTT